MRCSKGLSEAPEGQILRQRKGMCDAKVSTWHVFVYRQRERERNVDICIYIYKLRIPTFVMGSSS